MTTRIPCLVALAALALAGSAWGAEEAPTPAQAAFERLKSLEGSWAGPASWTAVWGTSRT